MASGARTSNVRSPTRALEREREAEVRDCALFPRTRWGRGFCVTEVRPGRRASPRRCRLWVWAAGWGGAPARRSALPCTWGELRPAVLWPFPFLVVASPRGWEEKHRPVLDCQAGLHWGRRPSPAILSRPRFRAQAGLGGRSADAPSPTRQFQ